jgi:hypothetical protein
MERIRKFWETKNQKTKDRKPLKIQGFSGLFYLELLSGLEPPTSSLPRNTKTRNYSL